MAMELRHWVIDDEAQREAIRYYPDTWTLQNAFLAGVRWAQTRAARAPAASPARPVDGIGHLAESPGYISWSPS